MSGAMDAILIPEGVLKSEPTIKELLDRIAGLESAIEALALKLNKEIKHNEQMDRLNTLLRKMTEDDVVDAFERITNIEFKIFPNLARDIRDLHRIIGWSDDNAWNPLDKRKPLA